ncbi:class I SAM-dependent methyltransferase [Virgibacillus halophilus]|uniref:Class I SAM-dependent methyltransferase n=1 Tax=Tigheibacillus halophilus TaxID=361280 RepID=A0ABU5C983_9BACI|nr:class I SAM-dependent methyltransferase [Virgibacillus halophilus]
MQVDGIDVSKTMKKQAAHRLDKEIEAGEVRLLVGDIADTGLRENHYQKVLAVNNFTLWPDKVNGLQRIFNALVPRGEIAITMQPRQDDAKRHRTRTFARKMKQDLKKSGFRHIRLYYKKFSPEMAVCATAIKPNKT